MVETSCLGYLNFRREIKREVFVDDSITRGEESEHVLDKVALVVGELVIKIVSVSLEVDFLGRPERSEMVFVHRPKVVMVDWMCDELVVAQVQKRLGF
jgi:hypothetical protein